MAELPVLYIHDDAQAVTVLRYVLGDDLSVLPATDIDEALELARTTALGLVLCEQRVRGTSGVDICARIREVRPEVPRIITATHVGQQISVDAIRAGHIACYVVKPWPDPDFINLVRAKIDLVRIRDTMRQLYATPAVTRAARLVEELARTGKLEAPGTAHGECDIARVAHAVTAAMSTLQVNIEVEDAPCALIHPPDLAQALALLLELAHPREPSAERPTVRLWVRRSASYAIVVVAGRPLTSGDRGSLSFADHLLRRAGGAVSVERMDGERVIGLRMLTPEEHHRC